MASLLCEKWRVKSYGIHSFSSAKWKILLSLFLEKWIVKLKWHEIEFEKWVGTDYQNSASKSGGNSSLKISTKYQESLLKSWPKFSFQISTKLEPQTIDQTSASNIWPNLQQVVFGRNKFSWPNGRLPPIACPTYSERYAMHPKVQRSYLGAIVIVIYISG